MNTLAYIDPGTGSMLFSLFIGIAAAASFGLRAAFLKLKFIFSGGKTKADESNNSIPFVIYSDHKRYWNVFRPICDEFEKRQIPLVYYTSSEDDPALNANYQYVKAEFIGEGNKAFAKLNFLKADILLATTPGLDVYQWKRSPDVKYYVHIPHTADELLGYRMFGLDYYDAVLCSGDFQQGFIRQIEELRPKITRKELVTVGSTYLDVMKDRKDNLDLTANKNKQTTVILAPSWGKEGILTKYGEKIIDALITTGFNIIVRPHPQTLSSEKNIIEPLQEKYKDSEHFQWNYDNDNFEVLAKSDILISDFSGIILDYSFIFDKPLIYADTSYNTLPYDADWLDETNWRIRILPELGIKLDEKDFPNLKQIIEETMQNITFKENRKKISNEAWQKKGCAAENAVNYLIKKHEEIISPKNQTNDKGQ